MKAFQKRNRKIRIGELRKRIKELEEKCKEQKSQLEKNDWQIRWRESKIDQLKAQNRGMAELHFADMALEDAILAAVGMDTVTIDIAEAENRAKTRTVLKREEDGKIILTGKNFYPVIRYVDGLPLEPKFIIEGEVVPEGYTAVTREEYDETLDWMEKLEPLARRIVSGKTTPEELPEESRAEILRLADILRAEVYEPIRRKEEETICRTAGDVPNEQ